MEHRCSRRKQLAIRVLLYKHGLPIQSGLTRDLSAGGVYVEARPLRWHKNEHLEIEFISPRGARFRLPVLVVHQNDQGFGLMFDDISTEQSKILYNILYPENNRQSFGLQQPAVGQNKQVA